MNHSKALSLLAMFAAIGCEEFMERTHRHPKPKPLTPSSSRADFHRVAKNLSEQQTERIRNMPENRQPEESADMYLIRRGLQRELPKPEAQK